MLASNIDALRLPTFFAATLLPAASLILNPDGTLEIFTLGADGDVYHNSQMYSAGSWYTTGAWPTLGGGGLASSPEALVNSSGIVSLFALGSDGNVHANYRISGNDWATTATWGPLSSNGNFIGTQPAIINSDGRLEVFALAADGNVYHDAQISSDGAWYTTGIWPTLGGNGTLLGAPPPKLLPGTPVKEYVYVNGQVIAIENAGP